MQNYETLTITCSDHYSLSGRFYAAQGTQQALPVLICPATGITQQFYHHF
ncbi:TPA_asm: alpha/beta hydrolase, partial [Salmonella enterica]|nr:alpha/beta hydrolase [Salmonella enterica]